MPLEKSLGSFEVVQHNDMKKEAWCLGYSYICCFVFFMILSILMLNLQNPSAQIAF